MDVGWVTAYQPQPNLHVNIANHYTDYLLLTVSVRRYEQGYLRGEKGDAKPIERLQDGDPVLVAYGRAISQCGY